jgi:hypothetical protein
MITMIGKIKATSTRLCPFMEWLPDKRFNLIFITTIYFADGQGEP